MAVRYAVANGNWSNTATWNGGTLPTSADDVYANNKTVTIDQNVTVLSLNNQAQAPAVAGGGFVVTANGLTITANINYTSGADGLTASHTGTLTIIGNITGVNTILGVVGLRLSSAGTVNITGNITSGQSNSANGITTNGGGLINITGNITASSGFQAYGIATTGVATRLTINGTVTGGGAIGINNTSTSTSSIIMSGACISGGNSAITNASTGTVTINTSQTAAGTAGVYAITNSSTGIININGDCLGALSSAPSNALILNNSSTGTVNISGSVTARSVSPSTTNGIVNNTSTGTINVGGNVSGGSVANTIGMGNGSLGTINVTGNITGGSHATNTPAIYSTTAGTIDVTGSATAGLYPALFSTSATATNILRGAITNVGAVPAYFVFKIKISPSAAQQLTYQDTNNNNRVLATSNISPNVPIQSNVRLGIVYGSLGEYTGTMAVPTPSNVRIGVATDNTIGTGELTAADFLNAILSSSNSAAIRLKNVSTVDITGNQLASY